MRAVILAAGRSTRLYPVTLNTPKCLLTVGNRTILDYQLDYLKDYGISQPIIVTGYLDDKIKSHVGDNAKIIFNPKYDSTNNIYSLWCARNELKDEEFIIMYSDLIFHKEILNNLMRTDGNIVLAVDERVNEETERVKIGNGKITSIGKEIPFEEASGVFLGLAKVGSDVSGEFIDKLDRRVENDQTGGYFTAVLKDFVGGGTAVDFSQATNLPWIEIDNIEDLKEAKKLIKSIT